MKRILIVAMLLAGPASAQIALTPHWDTSKWPGQSSVQVQSQPVKTKTTAQIQKEADEGWAYVRRLHPSWQR